MVLELKNLLLAEYEEELKKLSGEYNQIRFYRDRTETYTITFTNSRHLSDIDDMEIRITEYMTRHKSKSIIRRISDHYTYKKGLEDWQKRLSALKMEISHLDKPEYFNNQQQLTSMISDVSKKIEQIETSHTLNQLGLTFEHAVQLLLNNNISLCLTEDDKNLAHDENEYYHDNKKYNELSELVLVHKTAFVPNNDTILSNVNSEAFFDKTFVLNKSSKSYKITDFRNTIHFCLNGEVTSHAYGNFDNRKYAVLQPLTDELATKIKGFNPSDTYFEGKVCLDGAYILCPFEERETVSFKNPKSIVMPYKGKTVDKYADTLITILGYQCEKVGMWNWQNETADFRRIDHQLIDKYNFSYIQHSVSEDKESEDSLYSNDRFNKFMSFVLDTIKRENLNPYEVYDQLPNLIRENGAYIHHSNIQGKKASYRDVDEVFKKSNLGAFDVDELLRTIHYEGDNKVAYDFWINQIRKDAKYYNDNNRYTGYGLSDLYTRILYIKELLGSELTNYPVEKLIEAEEQLKEINTAHK